jgi:NADP-dependent 3-hydroxy acid dehydrogenase YdfG
MAGRLSGKVAIISGAAHGMGAAQAQLFAREGAKLFLGDIEMEILNKVAAGIKAENDGVIASKLDVTIEKDWEEAVSRAESAFGRIDILMNNAGIYLHKSLLDHSVEDFQAIVAVNQLGVLLGMKHVVPAMKRAGGGSIVNFSSIYGIAGAGFQRPIKVPKGPSG